MNVPSILDRAASALAPLALLILLAACASKPTAPTASTTAPVPLPAPAATPAPSPAAPTPRGNLATEALRLGELFRGTPVVFATQQDGSMRATVPRRFSFDAGSTRVKPPLAAVLDRIAKSQAQTTTRIRVTTPPDADSKVATLARDRATSVRDYLVGRGIATARLQAGAASQATDSVEVIVSEATR